MSEGARVQFVGDAIQPAKSNSGGVYARQRPGKTRTPDLTSRATCEKDLGVDCDDGDHVDELDLKKKQVCPQRSYFVECRGLSAC
jgi:hypothetical protein